MDVGGTSIHAGVVGLMEGVIEDTVSTYHSHAMESKAAILTNLVFIINEQLKLISKWLAGNNNRGSNAEIIGIGIAFPGPFDYENGICYITDLGKFDSLYGVNLMKELKKRITTSNYENVTIKNDFEILFENDANLFALGVKETLSLCYEKALCLTIGTGLGSAFIKQDNLVKGEMGVPESGFIYDVPFEGGIIDDYLSRRGILQLAKQQGLHMDNIDVKDLASIARTGQIESMKIFDIFGKQLGQALNPFIATFGPEVIVIGGQIAKSYDLFQDGLKNALTDKTVKIVFTDQSLYATFIGSKKLFGV